MVGTALITGAGGFLGQCLVKELNRRGWETIAPGRQEVDLTVSGALDRYLSVEIKSIFHLAAWTQAGDFCLSYPGDQWVLNQLINTNALAFWSCHPSRPAIITVGTSCAYAEGRNMQEDSYLVGEPTPSLYAYAMTKRMLQVGLESINRQMGLAYKTFVPSTLYGPTYPFNERKQLHFIYDIIRKMLLSERTGEKVELWGDGYQRRELIHIDDFIEVMLAEHLPDNNIYNVSSGIDYSIRDFVSILMSSIDVDDKCITYNTEKYTGAIEKSLSSLKLQNYVDVEKFIPLNLGLAELVTKMRNGEFN